MKVLVTIKVQVQLNAVANDAAAPLILAGNTSPIMSQGIGPNPTEKLTTYMTKATKGIHPGSCAFSTSYSKQIHFN